MCCARSSLIWLVFRNRKILIRSALRGTDYSNDIFSKSSCLMNSIVAVCHMPIVFIEMLHISPYLENTAEISGLVVFKGISHALIILLLAKIGSKIVIASI